jgi:hypothetical protein
MHRLSARTVRLCGKRLPPLLDEIPRGILPSWEREREPPAQNCTIRAAFPSSTLTGVSLKSAHERIRIGFNP